MFASRFALFTASGRLRAGAYIVSSVPINGQRFCYLTWREIESGQAFLVSDGAQRDEVGA